MSRLFYLTLFSTIAICGIIISVQARHNRELKDRIETENRSIGRLESELDLAEPAEGHDSQATETAKPDEPIATAHSESDSAMRIAESIEKIEQLKARLPDPSEVSLGGYKMLPDLLQAIKDLSLYELLEVADNLDESLTVSHADNGRIMIRRFLYLAVAEQDPARILERSDLKNAQGMEQSVIALLARTDPDAALERMKEMESSEVAGSHSYLPILYHILPHDIDKGLQILRQMKEYDPLGAYTHLLSFPLLRDKQSDLATAMRDPQNEDLKVDITRMMLASGRHHSGVTGMRRLFIEYKLGAPEVADAFREEFSISGRMESPQELLGWFSETNSSKELRALIPSVIDSWAKEDYNAAGEWLGRMPSSPIKDQAIQKFSHAVTQLDPEAAAIWATHIQDSELRSDTLQITLGFWTINNMDAVGEWVSEIESSDIRDEAINGFANSLGHNPEAATIWSHQIQDEEKRFIAVERSLNWWKQRDPEAAQQWLEDNGLDPVDFEN